MYSIAHKICFEFDFNFFGFGYTVWPCHRMAIYLIEVETKWLPFWRWHFQMYFM